MSKHSDTPKQTIARPDLAVLSGGRPHMLAAVVARIEETIENETHAIRTDVNFDLKASNARKSRHLYELNRAIKGLEPDDLRAEDREGIVRLRQKLAVNEATIRAHLGAVSEIAALVQNAIERHEADGTYSSTG
ncbi:hypothetical protein AB4144_53720, partial [Rhizobiaceae sp. 2RAB30]